MKKKMTEAALVCYHIRVYFSPRNIKVQERIKMFHFLIILSIRSASNFTRRYSHLNSDNSYLFSSLKEGDTINSD